MLVGIVLIALAFMAFTGRLGATDKSDGASDEAKSAGATSSQSAQSSATEGASESSAAPESSATQSTAPAEAKAPLTVLNAGGIAGLAAAGQAEFQAAGWEVAEIGNFLGAELERSTVFYPEGDEQAKAAAEALAEQYPELVAEPAPSDLGHDGVVVVLAGEWTPGG